MPRHINSPKSFLNVAAESPAALAPTPAASEKAPLSAYLKDIRDTPVLTAEEERQLGRTLRESMEGLRAAIGGIPGVSRSLLADWAETETQGRVAARLSERYQTNRSDEAEVLRALDALRQEVQEAAPRQEVLRAEIEAFCPDPHWLLEWLADAEASLAAHPRTSVAKTGLPADLLRKRLALAAQHRDAYLKARSTFVEHNLRLVLHMAKRFRSFSVPFSDLVQEGNMGLVRAVEKFDERRGFRFSTYAAWWIQQSFIRSIQKDSRVVRLPAHLHEMMIRSRDAEAGLRSRLSREPTRAEVAEALAVDESQLSLVEQNRSEAAAIDTPMIDDGGPTLAMRLAAPKQDPADSLDQETIRQRVAGLLRGVEPRARAIVRQRFGIGTDTPRTLQEIADDMGLSRERVRQIEKRTVEAMLKPALAGRLQDAI